MLSHVKHVRHCTCAANLFPTFGSALKEAQPAALLRQQQVSVAPKSKSDLLMITSWHLYLNYELVPQSRYILPIQPKLNIHCSEPFFEFYKIHECLQHYLLWDRPKHGIILRLVPPYLGLFLRWGTVHNQHKYISVFLFAFLQKKLLRKKCVWSRMTFIKNYSYSEAQCTNNTATNIFLLFLFGRKHLRKNCVWSGMTFRLTEALLLESWVRTKTSLVSLLHDKSMGWEGTIARYLMK